MVSRREFLGALAYPIVAGACASLRPGAVLADDKDFWFQVGRAFTVDRSLINLNNGGVSPATRFTQEAMKRHLDFSNQAPVYTMWRVLEPQREAVRQRLAMQFGCDTEEIAITRNASESLQICQLGFDLGRGDGWRRIPERTTLRIVGPP